MKYLNDVVRTQKVLGAGERLDGPDGPGLRALTLVESIDSGPLRHDRYVR